MWIWKTIGVPTANIAVCKPNTNKFTKIWDSYYDWVFKINVIHNWKILPWVWSFQYEKGLFESHILDFDRDIYWENIEVILLKKIRSNKKFESQDELVEQISKDIAKARQLKLSVITFWTFDKFHAWHEHYLNQAKKYWDHLITIVGRDLTVKDVKWKKSVDDENTRMINVKKHWVSQVAELWWFGDKYECIKKHNPDVICFGYDQISFVQWLEDFLMHNNLDPEIIRIWSHKPEIYKSSKM